MEPLSIALIWNEEDNEKVEKYINYTREANVQCAFVQQY